MRAQDGLWLKLRLAQVAASQSEDFIQLVVLALGMWNVLVHTEAVRLYLLAAVALGLSCSAGPQPFCPASQASLAATARVRTSWELI